MAKAIPKSCIAILISLQAQDDVHAITKHFFRCAASNPTWQKAIDRGILDMPLLHNWEDREFLTPIVAILTRPKYATWMAFHLTFAQISALPIDMPTGSKIQSRVRLTFHANNTAPEVEKLVSVIAQWAQEMIDLEDLTGNEVKIPTAARQVYALVATSG